MAGYGTGRPESHSRDNLLRMKVFLNRRSCTVKRWTEKIATKVAVNLHLLGLSGAVVPHHYFWIKGDIACGSTKYVTQWHLVSLSSRRTYTKFSDQLHCPLVNFRNNWSFYSTKERFPRQKFRHWHCFTSSSTHKGRVCIWYMKCCIFWYHLQPCSTKQNLLLKIRIKWKIPSIFIVK